MATFGQFYTNNTTMYSPVTLSKEWPTLGRLLLMVTFSCFGTTVNGFYIAAFFVERTLNRVGNVFLACVGLSDIIITTSVMPVSAVVLLSGQWDILPVCTALQFLTETATYGYSLFFTARHLFRGTKERTNVLWRIVGVPVHLCLPLGIIGVKMVTVETYYRLCRSASEYQNFLSMRIGLIAIIVFIICFVTAGVGVYLGLDYDYCQRKHYGNYYFRSFTSIVFYVIPFLVVIIGLLTSSVHIRRHAREHAHYRRSKQYERDFSAINLNLTAYIFFVIAWTPYLVIVHEYPNTSDNKFYHCVWIGMSRSVICSLLYSTFNRNFRRAFSHLFYYCCCKSTLSGSFNSRHRRAIEYKCATGDVRVHIMHQAVCINSPHRAASSSRETQEL